MAIDKKILEEKISCLFKEAKELLEEENLEWYDEFFDYKNYSPNFD